MKQNQGIGGEGAGEGGISKDCTNTKTAIDIYIRYQ